MGRRDVRFARRPGSPYPRGLPCPRSGLDGLCGQRRRPLGASGGRRDPRRPGFRPDLAAQSLGGRLLSRGRKLRGFEQDDGRGARSLPRVRAGVVAPPGRRHQQTHRAGDVFLRLRQCLPAGSLARRGCRDGRGRPFPLSLLCAGHHGADVLRLRLRPVPLGLHLGPPRRPRAHRPPRRRSIGGDPRHGTRRDRRAARRQHPLDSRGRP
ncbi:unknown [Alistipes sp. CAG:29]|nr:unknown [Alistipes sp. CAG:29]